MAIKEYFPNTTGYERKGFIIDTDADLADLPVTVGAGSTAISVESGTIFMFNASGEWKEFGGGE